MLFLADLTPSV